ncbi:MAG: hypothetical protein RSC84_02525 [Peptostreptococcaceae bacterium]|uniref:hypothetical protein n=1 Tax=Clostridium sp. TaxID=1506 RepID=UPI00302E4A60
MLKINKTINISGTSEIEGKVVVYMNASISTDGNTNANINKSIANQELYNSNKTTGRADMAEFEKEVHKVEDSLNAEIKVNIDSNEVVKTLKGKVGK